MDILYIVGTGSKVFNLELRCSLRSIDTYGINIGRVFVSGHCPGWLSDEVVKLRCADRYLGVIPISLKHVNIIQKILFAVDNSDIGDEFLVSMDDHFYTRPVDFDRYPHYVRVKNGKAEIPLTEKSPYQTFKARTGKLLREMGLPAYNFGMHRNIHLTRRAISDLRPMIDEMVAGDREVISIFDLCNNYEYEKYGMFNITPVKDIKFTYAESWARTTLDEVFSLNDFCAGSGLDLLLMEKYPHKSRFEV